MKVKTHYIQNKDESILYTKWDENIKHKLKMKTHYIQNKNEIISYAKSDKKTKNTFVIKKKKSLENCKHT